MTTMTTQVPAGSGGGVNSDRVLKTELPNGEGEDEAGEAEAEDDEDEMEDEDGDSPGAVNEDGELFDYIYGSESNDNYVMGE